MLHRIAFAAALALAPFPSVAGEGHDDHLSTLDGLRAVHAWSRATDGDIAFVFVEIENEGDAPVAIQGGETAMAETVELVGFALSDGQETYTPVAAVPVGAGRELHLEPDGLALRLTGLTGPLEEGSEFDLDLVTSIGTMELHVEVEAADATQHGHAGHNH
jgi:copper(I)-binding protein